MPYRALRDRGMWKNWALPSFVAATAGSWVIFVSCFYDIRLDRQRASGGKTAHKIALPPCYTSLQGAERGGRPALSCRSGGCNSLAWCTPEVKTTVWRLKRRAECRWGSDGKNKMVPKGTEVYSRCAQQSQDRCARQHAALKGNGASRLAGELSGPVHAAGPSSLRRCPRYQAACAFPCCFKSSAGEKRN